MNPRSRCITMVGLAALALTLVACGRGQSPSNFLADQFEKLSPPSPSEAARDAFNVYDPDRRRESVALLANAKWGGEAPYLKTYRLLIDDPDPTVRAASISALGRHGTVEDVPEILRYLNTDDSKIVRWEAAKALQKLHREQAIDPLITAMTKDKDKDVRMAAANALGQYPKRRVFDALVGAIEDSNYGVSREAVKSLQTLTGEDFGDRGEKWWAWAEANQQIFTGRQTYHYPIYQKPPSWWDKVKFWSDDQPPAPAEPRTEGDSPEPQPQTSSDTQPDAAQTKPAAQPEPVIFEGNLGASG